MTIPDAFTPLRNRNFAIFISAQTLSLIGTWAARTAMAYVVLQLTGSAATLGLLVALFAVPMVLTSPFAGAIADRGNRRLLLVASSLFAALIAAVTALLLDVGALQQWHVFVMYIALGVIYALDQPTADAITVDMNEGADIPKAANVMMLAQAAGRIIGALLAGLLLEMISPAAVFWFNALSFVPVALAMLLLTKIPQARAQNSGGSLLRDYSEGMRFAYRSPRLFDILLCGFVYFVLSLVSPTLYPAFVTYALNGSGADLGLFQGALGIGGVAAVLLVLPRLLGQKRTGLLVMLPMVVSGVSLLAMGLWTRSLWPAATLATLEAVASTCFSAISFGLIGSLTEAHMRGRIFSLFQLVLIGSQIPGALLSGYLAQALGPSAALAVYGAALLVFAIAMFMLRPALAAWRHNPVAAIG